MAVPECADREKVKGDIVRCGRAADIIWFIFVPCALLGIISDAANITLGLSSMSWFLLTIAALLAGIFFRIGWAVAWYLNTNK
jgi:hypothetical protein